MAPIEVWTPSMVMAASMDWAAEPPAVEVRAAAMIALRSVGSG
jgi:hypothetical protein